MVDLFLYVIVVIMNSEIEIPYSIAQSIPGFKPHVAGKRHQRGASGIE
jgi:hypothetical protein